MSNFFEIQYGVGAKGQPYGFETVREIAEKHRAVVQAKGRVYLSTKLAVSDKVKDQIDTFLFYNRKEDVCYLGHVVALLTGDSTRFIPDDAAAYAPADYADTPAASWFLLDRFEPVKAEELEGLVTLKEGIPILQKMDEPGRFPRFYFRKQR